MSGLPPGAELFDTADDLARVAAESVVACLGQPRPGPRSICLSGGSTPERLYRMLAGPDFVNRLPWDTLHLFWGDERLVPADHPDSNGRMALAALSDAPIPPGNVHRIPTEGLGVAASAEAYERELKAFAGETRPLFDVMLLGLGEDGHTASLFPGRPEVDETGSWVVGVPGAGQPPYVPRVSLTVPALSSCREALFLVSGTGKRAPLVAIAAGEDRPAGRIRTDGRMRWLITRDAVPG